MPKHGTAYGLGQYNEVLVMVTRALPAALDGTDPKAIIAGLQNRGEALGTALGGAIIKVATTDEIEEPAILRLISAGETLVIDPTGGTETIPASKGVFAYIDGDFKNWGADEASDPTRATSVAVHELARDATFAQMFSANPGVFCLTQSQILNFIKKHRNWLRTDGYATFFLFRSKGELFVAYVYFFLDRGGFGARVYRFGLDDVWRAELRHRIVLP